MVVVVVDMVVDGEVVDAVEVAVMVGASVVDVAAVAGTAVVSDPSSVPPHDVEMSATAITIAA